MNPCTILYAEDEADDVLFLELALKRTRSPHRLRAVPDGAQAIDYLAGKALFNDRSRYPLPALILLDINMPKINGLEVLQWIRQQPHFASVPVLMLTSSMRPEDMERASRLGANEYLLKPSDPSKLVELVKSFHERWLVQSMQPAIVTDGAFVRQENRRHNWVGDPEKRSRA